MDLRHVGNCTGGGARLSTNSCKVGRAWTPAPTWPLLILGLLDMAAAPEVSGLTAWDSPGLLS
jgi:hypothetical protein